MAAKVRIVVKAPLEGLWDSEGNVSASRVRDLGTREIKGLLREGSVQFVVANVGAPLTWIPPEQTLKFWRDEVQPHLVEPGRDGFFLEDFPDEYAYCASLWQGDRNASIILLEMHH